MDPNEVLRLIRNAITSATEAYTLGLPMTGDSLSHEALELFTELDDWPSRGGFLPTDWQPHSNVETRQRGMMT